MRKTETSAVMENIKIQKHMGYVRGRSLRLDKLTKTQTRKKTETTISKSTYAVVSLLPTTIFRLQPSYPELNHGRPDGRSTEPTNSTTALNGHIRLPSI